MTPIPARSATPGEYLTPKGRTVVLVERIPGGGARLRLPNGDVMAVGEDYMLTPVAPAPVVDTRRWTGTTLQGQTRDVMMAAIPELSDDDLEVLRAGDTRMWVAHEVTAEQERRAASALPTPDPVAPVAPVEDPVGPVVSVVEDVPPPVVEEVTVDEVQDDGPPPPTDADVARILDLALAEVRNKIRPDEMLVLARVDEALIARESLRCHLRPVLDLLEMQIPPQGFWNTIRDHLTAARTALVSPPAAVAPSPHPTPAPEVPLPESVPEPVAAAPAPPESPSRYGQAICPICGRTVNLRQHAKLGHHNQHAGVRCDGAGNTVSEAQAILSARTEREARPLVLPHEPTTSAVIAGPLPDVQTPEAAPVDADAPPDWTDRSASTPPAPAPEPTPPASPLTARLAGISADLRVVDAAMPHLLAAEAAIARLAASGVNLSLSIRLSPPDLGGDAPAGAS